MSLAEIVDILKKYPHPYLKSLLDKGKITYMKSFQGYAERGFKITLSPKLKEDDESMKQAFDQLSELQQEALFLHFYIVFKMGEKPILKEPINLFIVIAFCIERIDR